MTTFNVEAFEAGLAKAVEDKGESFVYEQPEGQPFCMYTDRDDPNSHCLIGQALINAGHEYDRSWETHEAFELLKVLGAPTIVSAAALSAQSVQDYGGTWGRALGEYRMAKKNFDPLDWEHEED